MKTISVSILLLALANTGIATPSSPSSGKDLYENATNIAVIQADMVKMVEVKEFGLVFQINTIKQKNFKGELAQAELNIVNYPLPYPKGTELRLERKPYLLVHLRKLRDNYYSFVSKDPEQTGGFELHLKGDLMAIRSYADLLVKQVDEATDAQTLRNIIFMMGGVDIPVVRDKLERIMQSGDNTQRALAYRSALYAGDQHYLTEAAKFLNATEGQLDADQRKRLQRLLPLTVQKSILSPAGTPMKQN